MFVGQTHLTFRTQHPVGLNTTDIGGFQVQPCTRNGGSGRRKNALHAGSRVRCTADHLNGFAAGVDHADAQLVGIGVLLGGYHMRDLEGFKIPRGIDDLLDLEADHGQRVGDLLDAGVGFEMILEPGQGEFHRLNPPCSDGTSKARNP